MQGGKCVTHHRGLCAALQGEIEVPAFPAHGEFDLQMPGVERAHRLTERRGEGPRIGGWDTGKFEIPGREFPSQASERVLAGHTQIERQ